MRSCLLLLAMAGGVACAMPAAAQAPAPRREPMPVYRLYNADSGDHVYTEDANESDTLASAGWTYEGVAFYAAAERGPGMVPVYRFIRGRDNHFYATSRRAGAQRGTRLEKVIGYIAARPSRGLRPLHDWYNDEAGRHFYTTQPRGEWAAGYEDLGALGYVVPPRR